MNKVFIATSLDGFIADENGGIDWLHTIPNPDNEDHGYYDFMKGIDALLMGRVTFETVLGFGIDWPYDKPVFVLSRNLEEVPANLAGKVFIVNGELPAILDQLHKDGYHHLYIDGGSTIQSFLREDLIDEMTITQIPILLGSGFPLFGKVPEHLTFELIQSKVFLGQMVQSVYKRKR